MTFYRNAQFKQFVLYYQRCCYIFIYSMTCMDLHGSLSLFSITTMHVVENKAKQQQHNHWGSLVSRNWEGTQVEVGKFICSKGLSSLWHLSTIQHLLLCIYTRIFSFQRHSKGKYTYKTVPLDISNFFPLWSNIYTNFYIYKQ